MNLFCVFYTNLWVQDEEIDDEVADYKNLELEVSDKSFELDTSNITSQPVKRKSSEIVRSNSTETKVKKITLNRHLTDELERKPGTNAEAATNGKAQEKKVVKLSELSAKEVTYLFINCF